MAILSTVSDSEDNDGPPPLVDLKAHDARFLGLAISSSKKKNKKKKKKAGKFGEATEGVEEEDWRDPSWQPTRDYLLQTPDLAAIPLDSKDLQALKKWPIGWPCLAARRFWIERASVKELKFGLRFFDIEFNRSLNLQPSLVKAHQDAFLSSQRLSTLFPSTPVHPSSANLSLASYPEWKDWKKPIISHGKTSPQQLSEASSARGALSIASFHTAALETRWDKKFGAVRIPIIVGKRGSIPTMAPIEWNHQVLKALATDLDAYGAPGLLEFGVAKSEGIFATAQGIEGVVLNVLHVLDVKGTPVIVVCYALIFPKDEAKKHAHLDPLVAVFRKLRVISANHPLTYAETLPTQIDHLVRLLTLNESLLSEDYIAGQKTSGLDSPEDDEYGSWGVSFIVPQFEREGAPATVTQLPSIPDEELSSTAARRGRGVIEGYEA